MLSQFSREGDKQILKDYFDVPVDVYPVGRLDYDSEGLLLLTNDKTINHRLLHPSFKHERTYWVQVEGAITPAAIKTLQQGCTISVNGKTHKTQKCKAGIFDPAPEVPDRHPPIRYRKNIPDTWIWLTLTEGKNRQVRKMTASVGFPTLRLIRYSMEKINIDGLKPGEMSILTQKEAYSMLFGKGN